MATASYPNLLDTPVPHRQGFSCPLKLLIGLLLLCAVLRTAMAFRIPSVDPDGVLYIGLAKALEAGEFQQAMDGMGLNTYPVVLWGFHRLGLDWETAGLVSGVVIGSLVVLPLYGWVRRQFDDRVALAAALLYVFHPQMIQWSPEITRDPTFWLLLTSSLYLLWRGVVEVRLRWFVLAGLTVPLAILTRFEGLILLFPMGLWLWWRFWALRESRWRLVVGAMASALVLPALGFMVNGLWLRIPLERLSLRLDPWWRFQTWWSYVTGLGETGSNPLVPADVAPMSLGRMLWVFFPTMTRGLSPLFALLMFGGLWVWRRVWARRDHQALFYAALGVLVGIWVHLWYDRAICPRYALSIVLLASPFAGLGLLGLSERMVRWGGRLAARPGWNTLLAAVPLVVVAGVGMADAMTANQRYFASRKLAAELGRWLRTSPWPAPTLVGPAGITPIVSYYAQQGRYAIFRLDIGDEAIIRRLVDQYQPEVLLVRPTKRMDPIQCKQLVEQMKGQGFSPIDPVPRPPRSDPVVVLMRGSGVSMCRADRPPSRTK